MDEGEFAKPGIRTCLDTQLASQDAEPKQSQASSDLQWKTP